MLKLKVGDKIWHFCLEITDEYDGCDDHFRIYKKDLRCYQISGIDYRDYTEKFCHFSGINVETGEETIFGCNLETCTDIFLTEEEAIVDYNSKVDNYYNQFEKKYNENLKQIKNLRL